MCPMVNAKESYVHLDLVSNQHQGYTFSNHGCGKMGQKFNISANKVANP